MNSTLTHDQPLQSLALSTRARIFRMEESLVCKIILL